LKRDPIGEEGGLNLYAIIGNNTINDYDYLGLNAATFDNDPKHVLGSCHKDIPCEENVALLKAFTTEGYNRLATDFTAEYLQKALAGSVVPQEARYRPKYHRTYDKTWNGHVDQYRQNLVRIKTCLDVIGFQKVKGECDCCGKFFWGPYYKMYEHFVALRNKTPNKVAQREIRVVAQKVTGAAIIAGTLAETVVTFGYGAVDDPPTIAFGIKLMGCH